MLCIFAVCLLAETAATETLHVPGEYAAIQVAIDAATDDDEIVVAPGTYPEAIDFSGKAITLRSMGGPEVTIIDAAGLEASVVTCSSGEGSRTVLDGFTITGGIGTVMGSARFGGGMFVAMGSAPTVIDCVFIENTATIGGGMYEVAHEWRTQGIAGTMSGGKDSLSWPINDTPNSSSVTPSVS